MEIELPVKQSFMFLYRCFLPRWWLELALPLPGGCSTSLPCAACCYLQSSVDAEPASHWLQCVALWNLLTFSDGFDIPPKHAPLAVLPEASEKARPTSDRVR
jgi:hypothetical protein